MTRTALIDSLGACTAHEKLILGLLALAGEPLGRTRLREHLEALGEFEGEEALGDTLAALRARGLAAAAKKSSRTAAEGLVGVAVSGTKGVAVEVNSETDFVAKNDQFQDFVRKAHADLNGTKALLAEQPSLLNATWDWGGGDFETGIVYVNAGTTGAETHLPFGGWKETGNGHREAGHAALDSFTEWKSIYVDFSGHLQRAQIDNQ